MSSPSIHIANATCSWGVLEFDLPGKALGYAQVLDEIRETGYAGTELGGWDFMPSDPAKLRRELDARNLKMVGAFVPVAFSNEAAHQPGEELALKTADLLAAVEGKSPFLVLADDNGTDAVRTRNAGRITATQGLSDTGWAVFAKGVQRIAKAVRERTGLRSVFHHHCAGYVETPAEIDRLLDLTDPELLGLCFDTGHCRFGGGEPLALLKRQRERIWHVHFKDCNPAVHAQSRANSWNYFESLKHGIFCELGQGDINFNAITEELHRTNYTGWIVVEQDVLPGMGAPRVYAQRNREFLRSCGL